MISKITFPLTNFKAQTNCCSGNKRRVLENSYKNCDSVSFSGKTDSVSKNLKLDKVIDNVFEKLAENRSKGALGNYFARLAKKNVDVCINETSLGKEANISLNNGKFVNGKDYVNLTVSRHFGKSSDVESLDDTVSAKDAQNIVIDYLDELK